MKNVGIIGAGASGLYAAKECLKNGHQVTIFEQDSEIGGVWLYSPEINIHSSMYENLLTNGPKETMGFIVEPLMEKDNYGRSFLPSGTVLSLLKDFAKPVKDRILFNHKVALVNRRNDSWEVQVQDVDNNIKTYNFDALLICTGHYFKESVPKFIEKYTGHWIHSRNYRRPTDFKDQTVVIVGGGLSGTDIMPQIYKLAKKIYLLHVDPNMNTSILPSNVVIGPKLVDMQDKTLIMADGTKISDIDTVIFCTGYEYTFPFFENSEPKIIEVLHNGQVVSPLFEHVAHRDYPDSLFFIAMCNIAAFFLLIEYNVKFAIAMMEGRAIGVDEEKIKNFEEEKFRELQAKGRPPKFFHFLGPDQFDYYSRLCHYAGVEPPKIFPVLDKIFQHVRQKRNENFFTYKSYKYRIVDGGDGFEFEEWHE